MDKRRMRGLIGLNVVLLAVLAMVTFAPTAPGQPGAPAIAGRARGDYTMVSGRMQGSTTNAVWVLDATNQELIVLGWDRGRKQLYGIGYRSLVNDGKLQQGIR